jgi:hypothetical protein
VQKIYVLLILTSLISACGGSESSTPVIIIPPIVADLFSISGDPETEVAEESSYLFEPSIAFAINVSYSITNKPSWASFDTLTGILSGVPNDADIGTHSDIIITATDDITSSSIGPFSITVIAVNDAPILADQTHSGLGFSSSVAFILSASDVDSASSSYVYSIIAAPTHGSIVITDHATSSFEYQPSSVAGISGDSFTVQLSDGESTSAIVTISLSFTDSSAIVISGSPNTSINEESAYSFTPTIDSAAVGSLVFSISNKPSWATFNTVSGALTGTPDDVDIGTAANITITATDDVASSNIGPFAIAVNAINDAPILADQTQSTLTFSSAVAFTLSASDVDSASSTYAYSVISAPSHGSIVITNHATSSFEYQPSSVAGISGDSFTLQLSDGSDVSNTRTITLAFSDVTAPSLTLVPNDSASNVAIDTTYVITSDDPLDTTTLSYNSSTGSCTGTVQISKDSFTNCIGITSAVASNLNRTITITGAADLDAGAAYSFKVSTGLASYSGINLSSPITNSFTTLVGAAIAISGTPNTSINEENAYSFTPTIDSAAVGSLVFSISNKPSWATFNTVSGALTGTPDDVDIGTAANITITATDDVASSSIGPFSISVVAVNDAPLLADQTKSGLGFSSAVAFTLTASDVDSASSSYVYSIIAAPTHGSIVITDHTTSSFEYQPSSVTGISGDSFTLQLSDGSDVSNTRTITLAFSDATAPSLTLVPNDSASNVAIDTTYVITSDDPLDTTTLSYNSSTGSCTGTVQISNDSFTNCIGITSAVASNLNRTITITGAADIDSATEYKMKVTTGVANLFAINVTTDVINTFNTAANGLLITEIGECYYSNAKCWFEVYNATSSTVDMSNYTFKSRYADGGFVYTAHEFSLPSVTLSAGQYIVIRAQDPSTNYTSNSRVIYAQDGTKFPFWNSSGYIDLIKSGVTEDFLTFGSSYSPTTAAAWSGTFATALPSIASQYGHSIGRDGSNADTNTAADWSSYDFSTMGGTNDVTCTTDADADGIPDCSEVLGSTFAGLPLYDWGARTGQKDIFIEVDYMENTNSGAQAADEGLTPRREALQNVVDSFAAQGIAVHFDVGDLYDQAAGIDATDFDLGGGDEVPFASGMSFDPVDSRANTYDYKRDYMDYARMQIFHYLVFANTQQANGSAGSSGLAELNGNDLIVTLGAWGLNSSGTPNTNTLINYQASTLMHELGHNLGLYHGGSNDGNNYEPNYISVMNYMYQLAGLPTIGSDEGDRYYYTGAPYGQSQNASCYSGLSNAASTATFIIDFSHGNGINLTLSSVNETLGLGHTGTDGVDYNCDGDKTDTSVSIGSGTYTDHDDWTNMNLDFQHYFSGNNSGISLSSNVSTNDEDELMPDKVGDDRTSIAEEFSPSAAFFQQLSEQLQE